MTQDEIISMAQDACSPHQVLNADPEFLKRFFKLAFAAGASHEREACANVCEENRWGNLGAGCAAAIRARNNKEQK